MEYQEFKEEVSRQEKVMRSASSTTKEFNEAFDAILVIKHAFPEYYSMYCMETTK